MATAAPMEEPRETECVICQEPFTAPKILPCGHLLCRHCLISWLHLKSDATCPMCRDPIVQGQKSSNPSVVADSFPTHTFMAAIIEAKDLLSEQHVCCLCVNKAAVALCVNCGDMFCHTHSTMHKKQPALRHHQVETLASLTADTLAAKRPVMCPVHSTEVAELFCSRHRVPICFKCASTDHRGCPYGVKAKNSARNSRSRLKEVAATLKTGEQKGERALAEIEEFLPNIARQTEVRVAEIKALQQHLEKAVQACCTSLMERALRRSSDVQTEMLDQKAELKKQQESVAAHSHIMNQTQGVSMHWDLINMAGKIKKRANTFYCEAGTLAPVKVNQRLTIDTEAVKRIEQRLRVMSTVVNEKVNVDAIDTHWTDTYLGVVTVNPKDFCLPRFAIRSYSNQILVVWSEHVEAFGRVKLEQKWPCLRDIAEGTRVGLALDQDTSLHLYIQGEDQGVIESDIPQPCYFMFDLVSRCKKVTALPVTVV